MADEDFGDAMMDHHDMHGRRAGAEAMGPTEVWQNASRPVKVGLLFVGAIAIASIIMVSYNISGRGSTHIDSGTGIDVVRRDKDHFVINALVESQNAKVGLDLNSDDDSDGRSPVRIVSGHIYGKFGFNNSTGSTAPGDIILLAAEDAQNTHLYYTVPLQSTIQSLSSGDVSYALAGSSINVSSLYRYEHVLTWQAVVTLLSPLERVCGYIGVDSLPNVTSVQYDNVHGFQCVDADANGYALFGGSAIVSLEGSHTIEMRMAANNDLQKRGVTPAEIVHLHLTATVV